mgnify:CR=1 FL=1
MMHTKSPLRAVTLLLAALIFPAGALLAEGQAESTALTVTGVGVVVGIPDTAVFSVGVEVTGSSPGTVLDESRRRAESVLDALRALGIPDRDIQTTHYNLRTERYAPEPGQRPDQTRYVATTGLRIDLDDLDRLETVIDTATDAGATELWGVQFGVRDSQARHDEARLQALADARRKAEEIAADQGLEITGIRSISTDRQATPGLYEGVRAMGAGGGSVAAGELEFREAVTVEYRAR